MSFHLGLDVYKSSRLGVSRVQRVNLVAFVLKLLKESEQNDMIRGYVVHVIWFGFATEFQKSTCRTDRTGPLACLKPPIY